MANEKKKDDVLPAGAPKVSDATDGGESRLTAGYKDNPDKPDPSSVAQVEVLKDEESTSK